MGRRALNDDTGIFHREFLKARRRGSSSRFCLIELTQIIRGAPA
jgi:hypothetical protein